jgi:hypothetical protein
MNVTCELHICLDERSLPIVTRERLKYRRGILVFLQLERYNNV